MLKFFINLFKKNDFTAKHSKIIGSFSKALADAQKLNTEMTSKISEKEEEIVKIQTEITEISNIQAKTSKFAESIAKLIE